MCSFAVVWMLVLVASLKHMLRLGMLVLIFCW